MPIWTPGDVSGSQILQEDPTDHLHAVHINELRQAVESRMVNIKDYGAVGDGEADDHDAVVAALAVSNIIYIGDLDILVDTSIDLADYANAVFIGNGSITGLYRKTAIPVTAEVPPPPVKGNIIPSLHLPALNAAAAPVAVIVGDSISTYLSNQTGRADLLPAILHSTLVSQFPDKTVTFHNRAIGGCGFNVFDSTSTTSPTGDSNVLWWTFAQSWMDYVEDLAPDVVFLAFGMNDAEDVSIEAIDSIVTKLQAFSKVPDIVFCTNVNPSLNPVDGFEEFATRASQEGRDLAAGVVRSYALSNGHGLLDFHRQFCAVRDGFDPITSYITFPQESIASSSGSYVSSQECRSVRYLMAIDGTQFTGGDGNDSLIIHIGSNEFDWCRIQKTVGGKIRISFTTGSSTDYLDNYKDFTLTTDFPSGVGTYVLEVVGNIAYFYNYDGGFYGGYNQTLLATPVIRGGGLFTPRIDGAGAGFDGLDSNLLVWIGKERVNQPILNDDQIFNRGDAGGSSYNHPGDNLAPYVYYPVINAYSFRE